jgi:hypothetical protein
MTPTRRTAVLSIAVALPAVVLAVIGVTHPQHLTMASALYWRNLHIVTLPIFPLLAVPPVIIARRVAGRWAMWVSAVLGFVFACFYTGLDVLAGIGAGGLELDSMGMATTTLFGLGRNLGAIGAIALIVDVILVGVLAIRSVGPWAVPGSLLLLVGSAFLQHDHIYFPVGVAGQVLLAGGFVWLVLLTSRRPATATPQAGRPASLHP